MPHLSVPDDAIVLGIDAGGTKSLVCGRYAEADLRHLAPGTNLQRDGLEACADRLADAASGAIAELPPFASLFLCAGVAGAGRTNEQRALGSAVQARLAGRAAEVSVEIVHDGFLALEAAFPDGASGVVAVAGTGSILLARTEAGNIMRAAGWGRLIGDPGSGTAIGRAALEAVADDFDGGEPTILRHRLANDHGVRSPEDLVRFVHQANFDPAALAPTVVEAAAVPDWAATRVLQQQANALARRAGWLASRAQERGGITPQVVLAGGMTRAAHYREVLAEAFLRHLPEWRIVRPHATPEEAALARAARLATA